MKKIILPMFLLAAMPLACLADEIIAEPVEVTGKAEASMQASPFEREIRIDRAAFEASVAPDVNGVLDNQPGIQINQNKPGSGSGISLKGASGGLGLLTFDGIPLFANFAGFYSIRNYPLDAVENIRISRNEGLTLENSRTLGGVIQMNSRRMAPGAGSLQLEAGSKQWVNGAAATGIGTALGDISIAAGWNETFNGASQAGPQNGGHEHDDQRLGHALVNIGKTFERGDLFASLYYAHGNDDIDGPALRPGPRVLWWDDPKGWFTDKTLVGQVSANLAVTDRWQSTLQIGGTRDEQDGVAGLLRLPLQLDSRLWLAKWQNIHDLSVSGSLLDHASLLWGLEYQDQHGESDATGKQLDQRLFSPSLGLSWEIGQWSFYGKIRQDQTEHDGNHRLWSAGTAWRPTPDTRLWANVGKTYRMAAVNEVIHPLFGNANLKPESGQGWDIGWASRLTTSSSVQLNYYRQNFRDLIIFDTNPATGISRAGNVADVVIRGFEAELRQVWTPAWNTTLQYGYMDAENRLTHLDVQMRPHNRLTLQNNLRLSDKLDLNLNLIMHDGFWFDNQHVNRAGSVVKLNGALHYAITPTTTAYLRAENLTDDDTVEVYGMGYAERAFYVGARSTW